MDGVHALAINSFRALSWDSNPLMSGAGQHLLGKHAWSLG